MTRRPFPVMMIVALTLAAAAGCAPGNGREPPPDCDPTRPPSWARRLPGPGTAVAGGTVVPDGTTLLGRRFPTYERNNRTTLLVVGCDPLGAFARLLDGVRQAGYTPVSERDTCTVSGRTAVCQAWWQGIDPAGSRMTYYAGLRGDEPRITIDGRPDDGPVRSGEPADVRPQPAVPEARLRTGVAGPGRKFGAGFTVERGSRMVAPAVEPEEGPHFVECSAGGVSAVFEVTGQPSAVHDAYVEQADGQRTQDETTDDPDGGQVRSTRLDHNGWFSDTTTMVITYTRPDAPTFVTVDVCAE